MMQPCQSWVVLVGAKAARKVFCAKFGSLSLADHPNPAMASIQSSIQPLRILSIHLIELINTLSCSFVGPCWTLLVLDGVKAPKIVFCADLGPFF